MQTSIESPSRPEAAGHLRRLMYRLRTEGGTPGRDAVAIGLGVFVGCSPFYGFHLAICWVLGRLLGLSRLKMYLAANVSNPFIAPFLVLAEVELGAWIRRDTLHSLTIDAVRLIDPWVFGADLLIGSLVLGSLLGAAAGLATWLSTRAGDRDVWFGALVRRASDRYVATSITAWEFARGKLRGDPLYKTVIASGVVPSGGVLVDVGCGQGLMLALLVEAAAAWRSGALQIPEPPMFDELVGIEMRPRVAELARRALASTATIVTGDARAYAPRRSRVVLFFDVLHMMPADDQEQLLGAMARTLAPGGIMLVREADAGAGWRFQAVRAGNLLKAIVIGHWRQRFHFRTRAQWIACFERAGFRVETRDTTGGTPFANVLFVLSDRQAASA